MEIEDLGNNYFQINNEKIYAPNISTAIDRYNQIATKVKKPDEPQGKVQLKDFQHEAVEECLGNFMFGSDEDMILYSLPASGKTVIASALAIKAVKDFNYRVVIAVNISELIDQFYDTLTKMFGYNDVAIIKAGYEYKGQKSITIVMQQTLYNRLDKIILEADLYIQDEWHLCGRHTTRTDTIISKINPEHVIGMTGTPYTPEGTKIRGEYIQTLSYTEMIEKGYLDYLNVIYLPVHVDIGSSGTDYNQKEMGEAYSEEDKIKEVIDKWLSITSFDPTKIKSIWFVPDIKTAKKYTEELQKKGLVTFAYTSDNDKNTDIIMDAFKKNKRIPNNQVNLFNYHKKYKHIMPRICVSVNKVSIGFNCPDVECVAMVGTTKIRSMFEQRAMRGGRISENKEKSYLVDFGENIKLHGHPQQNYIPIESDDFKEIKKYEENYAMPYINEYVQYNNNENITQDNYVLWIKDILCSTKSYSEMSIDELKLNFEIDNRIENLVTIAFAFMFLVHGEPMLDKWGNESIGYLSEKWDKELNKPIFSPVVNFYNERAVSKCINAWNKLLETYPENKTKWTKAFKTIARRYVNSKKNIFGLTYQSDWLEKKFLEEKKIEENTKKIEQDVLRKSSSNNQDNTDIMIDIDEQDIPF